MNTKQKLEKLREESRLRHDQIEAQARHDAMTSRLRKERDDRRRHE